MSVLTPDVGPQDHSLGSQDAPVTLVEFGDFECPYCGETVGLIDSVQSLMGAKLRYVFRHFPLAQQHPHAERSAQLAEAAAEAGKFWAMHRVLYENQHALDDRSLRNYGRKIGLASEAIEAAFADRYADRVREDFLSGIHSGVNATPTLFINGQRYDGRRDVRGLHAALLSAAE
jgi:protein-disulfide isomerase